MTNSAQTTKSAETKSKRLTPEQISELDIARRADGNSDDWVALYISEFPENERRDVGQLRALLAAHKLVLHETRDKNGALLCWSMSQDFSSRNADEPSFWLGCWTVTRRDMQSTGLGQVHFPAVVEALKREKPAYIGRVTEIESTDGQAAGSQPVRRARFYKSLGLRQVDVDYQLPLFQPVDAKEYIPQAQLGKSIPAQLLIAPFTDKDLTAAQVRSIIKRIWMFGYYVLPTDPFMDEQLSSIDSKRSNFLGEIKTGDAR